MLWRRPLSHQKDTLLIPACCDAYWTDTLYPGKFMPKLDLKNIISLIACNVVRPPPLIVKDTDGARPLLVPALSCRCSTHMADLPPRATHESRLHACNQVSLPGLGENSVSSLRGSRRPFPIKVHLSILTNRHVGRIAITVAKSGLGSAWALILPHSEAVN